MPVKRFLTFCCLLFALTGNAVLAGVHLHGGKDASHHTGTHPAPLADPQDSHHAATPDHPGDGCNDHCCHAGAHFLGLPVASLGWRPTVSPRQRNLPDKTPHSRTPHPLLQPPIT